MRAGSVLAGLPLVLAVMPVSSYDRMKGLQGVAIASSMPSTDWTAWNATPGAITGLCRPAVLLSCWALVAEPEDLLAALQCSVVGKVTPSQGVVLAHLAAAALRATIASGPALHRCPPAVQVAICALITCPTDHFVTLWFDVNTT